MNKCFLKIGDVEYRVETNWNAIADFCRRKGVSDLSQLDVLVRISIDDILPLMHCCLKEGERLEGRGFMMSEEDLGACTNTALMGDFMKCYASQSQADVVSAGVKKKIRGNCFSRLFSGDRLG